MFSATRLGAVILLAVLAACSSGADTSQTAQPDAVTVYPPGIQPFKNATRAYDAGLYTSYSIRGCCFLRQHASLTLEKPAGARVATLYFFVPLTSMYAAGQSITVSVAGSSATGSSIGGKWIALALALPPQYIARTIVPIDIVAAKSFVPAKLAMNNDTRDLSVVLQKVEYQ